MGNLGIITLFTMATVAAATTGFFGSCLVFASVALIRFTEKEIKGN